MYVPSNNPKYTCPKCRRKIAPDVLEQVFIEQLRGFVFSPQQIASYLESADQEVAGKRGVAEALEQERKKVVSEMEKVYRLYLGDHISEDGFASLYSPLEARLKQIDDALPELQAELDFLNIQLLSSEEVVSEAQTLYSGWEHFSFEERRVIVEIITQRIVVSEDEVALELCYVPFLKEGVNWQRIPARADTTGIPRRAAPVPRSRSSATSPRSPAPSWTASTCTSRSPP
jgi:hypothetical protein